MPKGISTWNYFKRRDSDRCRGERKESKSKKYLGQMKGRAELKGCKGELDTKSGERKKKNTRENAKKCLPLAAYRAAAEMLLKPG